MEDRMDTRNEKFKFTVEPAVFLLIFGIMLSSPVITTFYLQRMCLVTMELNSSVCLFINTVNKTVEALVQSNVTILQMTGTIIETFLPAVMSIFLGPWSDTNGRIPLLLWPSLGYAIKFFILLELSLMPVVPPYYFLLAYIPVSVSGGFISIFTAAYSYISDVSSPGQRTVRMGIIEGAVFLGSLLGFIGASNLYAAAGSYGFITIFGMSSFLCFVSFLYILLFLKESVAPAKNHLPYAHFFNIQHVKDMYQTCFKLRPNAGRTVILMLTFVLATLILTLEGESSVAILFVEEKFGWDIKNYTTLAAVTIAIEFFGLIIGSWLVKAVFYIPEITTAIIVFMAKAVSCTISAISPDWWYLYVGAAIGAIGSLSGPVCRSILSNTVPPDEVGKVFSLTSSFEALTPLVAMPLYSLLYNHTVLIFPGVFLLLSAGLFVFDAILLSVIPLIKHSSRRESDQMPIMSDVE